MHLKNNFCSWNTSHLINLFDFICFSWLIHFAFRCTHLFLHAEHRIVVCVLFSLSFLTSSWFPLSLSIWPNDKTPMEWSVSSQIILAKIPCWSQPEQMETSKANHGRYREFLSWKLFRSTTERQESMKKLKRHLMAVHLIRTTVEAIWKYVQRNFSFSKSDFFPYAVRQCLITS